MRAPWSYWKILGIVAGALTIANAVVTNVFVALMTPQDWAGLALPALGWALLLTALTTFFLLSSTIWLRRRARPMRTLLAFVGPATAWSLIGLIVGDWLFPIYAFYGVGVGIIASGVFVITDWLLVRSRRRHTR